PTWALVTKTSWRRVSSLSQAPLVSRPCENASRSFSPMRASSRATSCALNQPSRIVRHSCSPLPRPTSSRSAASLTSMEQCEPNPSPQRATNVSAPGRLQPVSPETAALRGNEEFVWQVRRFSSSTWHEQTRELGRLLRALETVHQVEDVVETLLRK